MLRFVRLYLIIINNLAIQYKDIFTKSVHHVFTGYNVTCLFLYIYSECTELGLRL